MSVRILNRYTAVPLLTGLICFRSLSVIGSFGYFAFLQNALYLYRLEERFDLGLKRYLFGKKDARVRNYRRSITFVKIRVSNSVHDVCLDGQGLGWWKQDTILKIEGNYSPGV